MKLDEVVALNDGCGDPQKPPSNESSDSSMTETSPTGGAAYCTFVVTGAVTSFQPIFVCHDCFHEEGTNGDGSNETTSPLCICQACADVCHNGDDHDVEYIGMGPCYCDCDHKGKCSIRAISQAQADRLLPPKSLDSSHTNRNSDSSSHDPLLNGHLQRVFDVPCLQNAEFSAAIAEEAQELIRHSKETFWLDKDSAPSDSFCRLEALAYKIYEHHRRHFDDLLFPDDQRGGAEWWVQVKDPNSSTGKDGAVDLHYDKDEALAEVFGLGSFPLLSTVTYVSASVSPSQPFNPTIVLEHTYSQGEDDMINNMLVSQPIVGKHLVFDGKLLHGAPAHPALRTTAAVDTTSPAARDSSIVTETNTVASSDTKRITFLVNIWKQKPANVHSLPNDIREVLVTIQPQSLLKNHELDKFVMSRREIPIIPLEKEDDLPAHLRRRIELPFVSKGATWEDQLSCKDKGNNDDDDDDHENDENDDENNNGGLVVVLFPPPPVASAAMDTFIVHFGPGLQAYMDYPHLEQRMPSSNDPPSPSHHETCYV